MAVIKNLAFCPKYKINKISSLNTLDSLKSGFVPFPIDLIHYFLPLKVKFLAETFVALDKGTIKGIISIEKEIKNPRKLKITKFFLEENCFSVGEQLINFVIAKYYAHGVTSFQVVFAQELEDMLDLFVNTCKFRICSHEFLYKTTSKDFSAPKETDNHFKIFKNHHAKPACELHNDSLCSHLRHSFIRHPKQYSDNFFSPLSGVAAFKYVLEDEEKAAVYAHFTLSTTDNENYLLETTLSPAFDGYFMDVVNFVAREVSRRSKNWNLYIKIKNCYTNAENLQHQLEFHKFELYRKNFVLTKDFMRPVKQEGTMLQNARIIFNNTAAEI